MHSTPADIHPRGCEHMGKSMTLDRHLADLFAIQQKNGNDPDRLVNQYVTKFPVGLAITFVDDCINEGQPPGIRLRHLVKDYYQRREENGFIELTDFERRMLATLAALTGESVEGAIHGLIRKYVLQEIEAIRAVVSGATVEQVEGG